MALDPDIRVLSLAQARSMGLSRDAIDHAIRAGHWRRLLPHTYLVGRTPATRPDLCRAGLLFAGRHACISGAAAAELHGLLRPSGSRILVLASPSRRHLVNDWIQIRPTGRLPAPTWRTGLAIAPAARAVADWALGQRSLDDVRATVARAVQRQHCSVPDLERELRSGPRRDSALLRQAIDEISAGARSAPEARAARALAAAGLGRFEQNAAVGPYFVDFLWRGLRAILEIDSVEYHFEAADWARTLVRHRELESMGYSVIHIRPSELMDEFRFVADVSRWLDGLGRRRWPGKAC